jgi:hypothetical protein
MQIICVGWFLEEPFDTAVVVSDEISLHIGPIKPAE